MKKNVTEVQVFMEFMVVFMYPKQWLVLLKNKFVNKQRMTQLTSLYSNVLFLVCRWNYLQTFLKLKPTCDKLFFFQDSKKEPSPTHKHFSHFCKRQQNVHWRLLCCVLMFANICQHWTNVWKTFVSGWVGTRQTIIGAM